MPVPQGTRRLALALAALLALPGAAHAQDAPPADPAPPPAPAAAAPPPVAVQAVDETYRGSRVTLVVRGDEVVLDGRQATGPLQWRLRTARPVLLAVACSRDVSHLRLDAPSTPFTAVVDPEVAAASVRVVVPGLGERIAGGADGCRARVSEPGGYRVADIAVGLSPAARRALYRQSLRTGDRDRQALAAAEAGVTSALTWYVTHHDDLRGWGPTTDGRVPGELVLRLRLVTSIRAVALHPAYDDVIYLVVRPDGTRSRDRLQLVAASTARSARLVVIGRDLRTGRLRYQVLDRRGLRVRYDSDQPPFPPCSDPRMPSRCTDPQGPGTTG